MREITKVTILTSDEVKYEIAVYFGDYPLYVSLNFGTRMHSIQDARAECANVATEYSIEQFAEALVAAHSAI